MNQYINPLIHILVRSKYLQFDDDLVVNPSTHDMLEGYLYQNNSIKYYIVMLLNILCTMKFFKYGMWLRFILCVSSVMRSLKTKEFMVELLITTITTLTKHLLFNKHSKY